jgi:8-hydroxy-5-deazaflavin:NADPH oxidoreductase
MKVGILGTGDVGHALGKGFLELGHEVKMGARQAGNPKARAFAAEHGPRSSAGTFAEAAEFGQVVVLATRGLANESALRSAGPERLAGKLVLDATNPLDASAGPPRLAVGHTDSGGEQVQRLLPGARVVKVFNTVGNPHMFRPDFPGGPPDMFMAGDDEGAKRQVAELLRDFGWNAIDLGGIEASRLLEALCMVWVTYAVRTNTWNHAFKLLKK